MSETSTALTLPHHQHTGDAGTCPKLLYVNATVGARGANHQQVIEMDEEPCGLQKPERVPHTVLKAVLNSLHLLPKDLVVAAQVCRLWHSQVEEVWPIICAHLYPTELIKIGPPHAYASHKALVLDANRRYVAHSLQLPPGGLHSRWKFNCDARYYHARLLACEFWDHPQEGCIRVAYDVRGESDLRLPATSTLVLQLHFDDALVGNNSSSNEAAAPAAALSEDSALAAAAMAAAAATTAALDALGAVAAPAVAAEGSAMEAVAGPSGHAAAGSASQGLVHASDTVAAAPARMSINFAPAEGGRPARELQVVQAAGHYKGVLEWGPAVVGRIRGLLADPRMNKLLANYQAVNGQPAQARFRLILLYANSLHNRSFRHSDYKPVVVLEGPLCGRDPLRQAWVAQAVMAAPGAAERTVLPSPATSSMAAAGGMEHGAQQAGAAAEAAEHAAWDPLLPQGVKDRGPDWWQADPQEAPAPAWKQTHAAGWGAQPWPDMTLLEEEEDEEEADLLEDPDQDLDQDLIYEGDYEWLNDDYSTDYSYDM